MRLLTAGAKLLEVLGGEPVAGVQAQRFFELLLSLLQLAFLDQGHAQVQMGHRVAGPEPKGLLEFTSRVVDSIGKTELLAEQIMRFPGVGTEPDSFLELPGGFFGARQLQQHLAQLAMIAWFIRRQAESAPQR